MSLNKRVTLSMGAYVCKRKSYNGASSGCAETLRTSFYLTLALVRNED